MTRLSAPERREQLLDATKAIVAADGFHAVSVEAIARSAGITRPIVYHHFDGLDDVLVALVERETSRALEQLAGMVSGKGLLASFETYLAAVEADPVTWRLVLIPPEGLPAVLREQIGQWRASFAAAIAAGPSSPDPELTGMTLQALADEGARLLLAGYDRERILTHARWVLAALNG